MLRSYVPCIEYFFSFLNYIIRMVQNKQISSSIPVQNTYQLYSHLATDPHSAWPAHDTFAVLQLETDVWWRVELGYRWSICSCGEKEWPRKNIFQKTRGHHQVRGREDVQFLHPGRKLERLKNECHYQVCMHCFLPVCQISCSKKTSSDVQNIFQLASLTHIFDSDADTKMNWIFNLWPSVSLQIQYINQPQKTTTAKLWSNWSIVC